MDIIEAAQIHTPSLQISDFKHVYTLDVNNSQVDSLHGVQYFKNVEYINISGCDIKSLEYIQSILSLKILDCSDTKIQSEEFRKVKSLKSLYTDNIKYFDISDILHLSYITDIFCDNNLIANFDYLHLLSLEFLSVKGSRGITFESIKKLSKLESLFIDITDDISYTKLYSLDIQFINGFNKDEQKQQVFNEKIRKIDVI